MPVSHIGLTVSHLPTSTSFFLAALQPLGYRYIGQQGSQIGLGIRDADFFLCQETPGVKAGAAHIAFTAPSHAAVRDFYTAALTAGGRPNGAPATRRDEDGLFNCAILDFDGNSIEVVHRNTPDVRDDGTVIEHSRVITWRRTVSERYHEEWHDNRSVISSRISASRAAPTEVMSMAPSIVSKAPSAASKAPSRASHAASIARSVSEPVVPQVPAASDVSDGAAKKIIGTLIGAAAGAAVAYAMVKSEHDSAKKEADFNVFMEAKNAVKAAASVLSQVAPQPQQPTSAPLPAIEAAPTAPESVHRDIDVQSYYSASPSQARSVHAPRQIEAPPTYYSPTVVSMPATQAAELRAIEYAPAHAVAPSQARSRISTHRSVTSPEMLTVAKARSVVSSTSTAKPQSVVSVSKPLSVVHSTAPSTLISSFVPDHEPRRSSEGSIASHRSSKSKAKSSHTHASRHTSHTKHSSSRIKIDENSSQAPASKAPSKAASVISSILGRDAKSSAGKSTPSVDDWEIEELTSDGADTVAPSDSISNVGSSRRRHRRSKHSSESVVSKQSSASKHSKSSKHSHRSHRSHKSRHSQSGSASEESDDDDAAAPPRRSSRPSVISSEPSDASTIKPIRKPSSRAGRKDSLTQGQYDALFEEVRYGTGSVRGVTPSMISAAEKNQGRSMMNYALAQRLRAFEGQ